MGNCQAIDNASLVIQHPSGKADKLYSPVSATEIMKINPGHYVALLLTTTLYSSSSSAATVNKNNVPLRVTRIKLLKPTDTLVVGHVYRLVTTQEVMKGLWAKKQARMKQQDPRCGDKKYGEMTEKQISDYEELLFRRRTHDVEKTNSKQVKQNRSRSSNYIKPVNSEASKSTRSWEPSLGSISEVAGT